VKTTHEKVLATVYKKDKSALIHIASWAEAATNINLMIDWKKLGLNPSKCSVYFPEVKNFQNASKANIENGSIKGIQIDKAKGFAIIIKEN
jgi:hypothetical protein